jgi:hypothetical protein
MSIRIPKAKTQNKLRVLLTEDEEFRFPRVKLDRDKPRFILPAPLEDDEDNTESKPTFKAVVLVAKKNFFQSEQDKKEGKDPKEKRALYILREGQIVPELVYVNPTSLRAWRELIAAISNRGGEYYHVLVEFSAEKVVSKTTDFKWMKFLFKEAGTLTEEEIEYINELRPLVEGRIREYTDDSQLADIEDKALGEERPKAKEDDDDEEDPKRHSKKAKSKLENDDDEDEDEDEKPKKKAKSKPADDDDDEDEAPKKKAKAKAKSDDDDEDLPKGKAKAKQLDDDDDDEDEAPKKKAKSKPADDDDDDDADELVGKKKPKGKAKAADLEDDDED